MARDGHPCRGWHLARRSEIGHFFDQSRLYSLFGLRVGADGTIANEAITLFVNGEPESAKLILRDLVNATVGFEALAEEIHKSAKSLHRMLSQSGNPTMSNTSAVLAAIKRALKVEVHTQIVLA